MQSRGRRLDLTDVVGIRPSTHATGTQLLREISQHGPRPAPEDSLQKYGFVSVAVLACKTYDVLRPHLGIKDNSCHIPVVSAPATPDPRASRDDRDGLHDARRLRLLRVLGRDREHERLRRRVRRERRGEPLGGRHVRLYRRGQRVLHQRHLVRIGRSEPRGRLPGVHAGDLDDQLVQRARRHELRDGRGV